LRAQEPPCPWSKRIFDGAKYTNNLEILEWLKTQNTGWILNKVNNPTIDIPHEDCCICLENIVNVQTVCLHNYCYNCLCENFETRKECPLCRTIITHVFVKEE
jgi:hypothetical protein